MSNIKVIAEREDLVAVANAIRNKTGETTGITLSDMPTAIGDIVTEPTLQSKTVSPTASSQTVKPDSGYDGLSQVTVAGDSNLVADNIKSGVSIFGVNGSYEGSGSDDAVETCTVEVTLVSMGLSATRYIVYEEVLEDGTIQVVESTMQCTRMDNSAPIVFTGLRGGIIVCHTGNINNSISDSYSPRTENVEQIIVRKYVALYQIGKNNTATLALYP